MLGLVVAGTLSSRFNKNVDLTFIERGTSRRQADKFSKRERSEGEEGEGEVDLTKVNINRIRCDLSDVDMSRLPLKPETSNIAIAKHLCGAGEALQGAQRRGGTTNYRPVAIRLR